MSLIALNTVFTFFKNNKNIKNKFSKLSKKKKHNIATIYDKNLQFKTFLKNQKLKSQVTYRHNKTKLIM